MNLADIRKKALEERAKREATSSPETVLIPAAVEAPVVLQAPFEPLVEPVPTAEALVFPEPLAVHEPVAFPEAELLPEPPVIPEAVLLPEPVAVPEASVIPEPVAVAVPQAPPRRVSTLFDPVAAILAGREEVDLAAETPTEQPQQAVDQGVLEFLCFRVAGEEYAINILDIKEIIKLREMTDVPRTPGFVSGIFSLRGLIVPVFDMRRRLGHVPGSVSSRERVLVVKHGSHFCGLHVDEVRQVVKIHEQAIEPPPALLEGIDREFVSGIGRHEGRILILLNLEKILDLQVQ